MVFTAVYQTKTTLTLGTSFTSSHTLKGQIPGSKITYSATKSDNVVFNKNNGNFTVRASEVGKISFIVSITMANKCGCNIPIDIDIVESSEESLQYSYLTSYPYLTDIESIIPDCSPYADNCTYSLVGAPSGITIDPATGVISGKATSYG